MKRIAELCPNLKRLRILTEDRQLEIFATEAAGGKKPNPFQIVEITVQQIVPRIFNLPKTAKIVSDYREYTHPIPYIKIFKH